MTVRMYQHRRRPRRFPARRARAPACLQGPRPRTLTVSSSSTCTLNVCCCRVFSVIVSIVSDRESRGESVRGESAWRCDSAVFWRCDDGPDLEMLWKHAIYLLSGTRHFSRLEVCWVLSSLTRINHDLTIVNVFCFYL